jgi:hypothetical protein
LLQYSCLVEMFQNSEKLCFASVLWKWTSVADLFFFHRSLRKNKDSISGLVAWTLFWSLSTCTYLWFKNLPGAIFCQKTCWLIAYLVPSLTCFLPPIPTSRFRSNTASIYFKHFFARCLSLIVVFILLIYCSRMGFTQTFPHFLSYSTHLCVNFFSLPLCVVP